MTLWNREPAVLIGVAVTIVLNAIATLNGEGLISDAAAGNVTDLVNGVSGLLLALLPLITAVLIRGRVYSPASVESLGQ